MHEVHWDLLIQARKWRVAELVTMTSTLSVHEDYQNLLAHTQRWREITAKRLRERLREQKRESDPERSRPCSYTHHQQILEKARKYRARHYDQIKEQRRRCQAKLS